MIAATQISGNIRPDNQTLDVLISTLGQFGINATYPSVDEPSFYVSDEHLAWRHYDKELALYEAIASSPFHIVFNDGEITEDIGRQVLYAMAKSCPILMTGVPTFASTLSPFTRDIIVAHMPQFHSISLPHLEPQEMKSLINDITTRDYGLTKNERTLIQSRVKAHFRKLLDQAQNIYVKK